MLFDVKDVLMISLRQFGITQCACIIFSCRPCRIVKSLSIGFRQLLCIFNLMNQCLYDLMHESIFSQNEHLNCMKNFQFASQIC